LQVKRLPLFDLEIFVDFSLLDELGIISTVETVVPGVEFEYPCNCLIKCQLLLLTKLIIRRESVQFFVISWQFWPQIALNLRLFRSLDILVGDLPFKRYLQFLAPHLRLQLIDLVQVLLSQLLETVEHIGELEAVREIRGHYDPPADSFRRV